MQEPQLTSFTVDGVSYELTPKALFIIDGLKSGLIKTLDEGCALYYQTQINRNLLLEMGYHKD